MIFTFLNTTSLLAFALAGDATWWNYPGVELWRFINLVIFVVALILALKKFGIPQLFRDRKESIKRDLARAQQERDAAIAKLKEVEERLTRLDSEIAGINERSQREAAEERARIAVATETEINKLSEQAQRDIESAGKTARHELRRYTAEQSVHLAEDLIRREMRPEDDARLISQNIEELGGPAR